MSIEKEDLKSLKNGEAQQSIFQGIIMTKVRVSRIGQLL